MKKKVILAVAALVIFGVGFASGMEYKAYQVRTAIENAFSGMGTSGKQEGSPTTQPTNQAMHVIKKAIGDEIVLATMKWKVNSVTEQQSISSSYGSPKVAPAGTKFVVINLDVTNTTNSQFTLSADETFQLVDNKKRTYQTYSDTIGNIDNYIDESQLSPSITQTGVLVYNIPSDSTSYSLQSIKAGTKDLYSVVLK